MVVDLGVSFFVIFIYPLPRSLDVLFNSRLLLNGNNLGDGARWLGISWHRGCCSYQIALFLIGPRPLKFLFLDEKYRQIAATLSSKQLATEPRILFCGLLSVKYFLRKSWFDFWLCNMAQNQPASRKRRREPYNVDVKLVEIYEDLANENDEIRLKAAKELVSRFTPDKNPTDEQIQKALQRLFRGLCSGRKAARVGFSVALTEVLAQVFLSSRDTSSSQITIPKTLEIWESQSNSAGSESGQVCIIHLI